MPTTQRKQEILTRLQRDGQVQVGALSTEWNTSPDTVRRDLRELAREGLLQRVHGGALPVSTATADYGTREEISVDAKQRVGRSAAGLVQPGQIIAVDGGTTTLRLVQSLPATMPLTIITHSPTIAAALRNHSQIEVILIDGHLYKHSMVSVGAATAETIATIQTDTFFLEATGVHPEAGVTTGNWEQSAVKRAFCDHAAEVVLVVTPEKLNSASSFKIVSVSDIDTMVFDHSAEESATEAFRNLGVATVVSTP